MIGRASTGTPCSRVVFIDTNVLISSRFAGTHLHAEARRALDRAIEGREPLRISRQVIREYLAVVTRPQNWNKGLSRQEACDDVDRLIRGFEILENGPTVTSLLLRLCTQVEAGGRQIHDANIVATMLIHGERRLLTFNKSDFRRFGDRIELVGG